MPRIESRTFETSKVFEKYGQKLGTVVTAGLLLAGIYNGIDEVRDYQRALDSEVCETENTEACNSLLSIEREDSLRSGLGGLAFVAGLGHLVFSVSRRESLNNE